MKRLAAAAGTAATLALAGPAQAVDSVRLADVIRANGTGSVNLMLGAGNVPVSATHLENLRLEHRDATGGSVRNFLSLGVDVNENAKGMEGAAAMGITLSEVRLTVVRPTGTTVYTEFRTQTRALLAPAGTTARQWHHTVLGEAGSSRITSANAIRAVMDSTLDIFVPDSLADATSAVLSIKLLDVNKSLGDPESFYDYSGGYEDLAVLNRADASYLNITLAQTAGFRADAPAVEPVQGIVSNDTAGVVAPGTAPASWSYFPSASGWYTVAYEDNYPNQGDYDFNDAVVAYRYRLGLDGLGRVMRVEMESYLIAEGAWYTLDWRFRLPLSASGSVTCRRMLPGGGPTEDCTSTLQGGVLEATVYDGIDNSGRYFSGTPSWASNAVRWSERKQGAHGGVSVVLEATVEPDAVGAADPRLFVRDTGQTIGLSSRDASGFPYALLLPHDWRNPYENVDMGLAYPRFRPFVESRGATDAAWYLAPIPDEVVDTADWAWGGGYFPMP